MIRRKIIKNSIQCNLCGDIIESEFDHNLVECTCGACFVDGGHAYQRIGFKEEGCFTNLSVFEDKPFRYKNEELNKLLEQEECSYEKENK